MQNAQPTQREQELEELALVLTDHHHNSEDLQAIELWYRPGTWDADPAEAKALTQKLVRGIPHGYSGYYNLPEYPNQNTRNGFTHA